MSQLKNAAELCTLVVGETYGELTSRIFAILLSRGRLSIPHLAQRSRLTPRQVRHGLVVLLQQNLAYFYQDIESNLTYYEANPEAALFLLRSGKALESISLRYGAKARGIVQNLLLLGHTRIEDLAAAYLNENTSPGLSNGTTAADIRNATTDPSHQDTDPKIYTPAQLDDILHQLLRSGFVELVAADMFRSPADTHNDVEKEILKSHFGGSTKGTKQKEELRQMIDEKVRKLQSWASKSDTAVAGSKRSLNGSINGNGNAKQRLSTNGTPFVNGNSHNHTERADKFDRNLVVRVNAVKCTAAARNQQLSAFAASRLGDQTSVIYSELLNLLEEKRLQYPLDDVEDVASGQQSKVTVSTLELEAALDKSIDPSAGIGKVAEDKIDLKKLKGHQKSTGGAEHDYESERNGLAGHDEEDDDLDMIRPTNGDDVFTDASDDYLAETPHRKRQKTGRVTFEDRPGATSSSSGRRDRMTNIKRHLFLLAEDHTNFIYRCGSRGLGEWSVDYELIVNSMRDAELDHIIFQRFGRNGLRLARILRRKGKLDEKQLPNIGLLKQKDVRTKLVEMQMAGFVDIQEVPRDNSRTAARSMFFWFLETDRIRTLVLDNTFKTMIRCFQTLDVGKRKESEVLSLANRTDVQGQEEEMLAPQQLSRLLVIRDKEEKLLGQIARLDQMVGIFEGFA